MKPSLLRSFTWLTPAICAMIVTASASADGKSAPPTPPAAPPPTISFGSSGTGFIIAQDPDQAVVTIHATTTGGAEIEWSIGGAAADKVYWTSSSHASPSNVIITLDENASGFSGWKYNQTLTVRASIKGDPTKYVEGTVPVRKFRRGGETEFGNGQVSVDLTQNHPTHGYTLTNGIGTTWTGRFLGVSVGCSMMNGYGTTPVSHEKTANGQLQLAYQNSTDVGAAADAEINLTLVFNGTLINSGTSHAVYWIGDNTDVDIASAVAAGVDNDQVALLTDRIGDGYRGSVRSVTLGITGGAGATGPSGSVALSVPISLSSASTLGRTASPGGSYIIKTSHPAEYPHSATHTLNPAWLIRIAASSHCAQQNDDDWDLGASALINTTLPETITVVFEPAF